jgi:hypothetical protein
MGWCNALEDTPDADTLARARAVKRYAQQVVKLAKQGRYDPEKTARARALGISSAKRLEGLADGDPDAFTPAQLAYLRRLSAQLRAYARGVAVHHTHPGGGLGRLQTNPSRFDRAQLAIGTKHEMEHTGSRAIAQQIAMDHLAEDPAYYRKLGRVHRARRPTRITNVPIQGWEPDDEDDEMGFLPALAPILGAVAPMIGGLLGGGDKGGGAAPAAPQSPVAASAGSGMSLPAIGGVVADQIRAVPPPVRQQVTDAVREIMDRQKAGQMDVTAMMKQIADLMGPKLKAQLDSVNQAALQRQATYEHESLKRRDERWKQNQKAQQAILARLNDMETKLGTALVTAGKRRTAVARAWGIPPRYQ